MGLNIDLYPKRVVMFLGGFAVGFLCSGIVSHYLKYSLGLVPELYRWLNVDGEKNFPALFSTGMLLLAAALLLLIAIAKRTTKAPFARHWMGLAAIFALMAVDEWLSFHEKLGGVLSGVVPDTGIFHFAWTVAGIGFVLFVGLAYSRFLLALPPRFRRLFLIAAGIFIAGAIGMEMAAGLYADMRDGWSHTIWLTLTSIEEGLEMSGVIVFIYALLNYCQTFIGELNIRMPEHGALLTSLEAAEGDDLLTQHSYR